MKGDGISLTPASGALLPRKDLFAGPELGAFRLELVAAILDAVQPARCKRRTIAEPSTAGPDRLQDHGISDRTRVAHRFMNGRDEISPLPVVGKLAPYIVEVCHG